MTRTSFLRFGAAYLLLIALGAFVFQPQVATQATQAILGMVREDAAAASGDRALPIVGVRTAACGTALSGTAGDYNWLQFDANGNLCINLATNSSGSTTDTDDGSVAASQASLALTLGLNLLYDGAAWTRTGYSIHRSIDLDEGAGEVVKASPGRVYGGWVTNTHTATQFVKFYNATSCTMGTGTPVITLPIPGNASDDITGNFGPGGVGVEFSTGICVGATTGVADNDTGAPGANTVVVNFWFK